MKHFLPIFWWLGAIPLIAFLVASLGYPLSGAFGIAVLFLPGMLCARFFLPQLNFEPRIRGIRDCCYLISAILLIEYLSLFLANFYITQTEIDAFPPILMNPVFLLLILTAVVTPEIILERYVAMRYPLDSTLRFVSDRRQITLDPENITYIESNDSEVWIHTASGESHRTKTRISQWEGQLDRRFLRIHRSYIVNTNRIGDISPNRIVVDGKEIEISRKYKEEVRRRLATHPEAQPE